MTLQELRLRRGKSIPQMALEAEVPAHVIRHAEAKGGRPHPENALKIARYLGVDVLDLWPIEEEAA